MFIYVRSEIVGLKFAFQTKILRKIIFSQFNFLVSSLHNYSSPTIIPFYNDIIGEDSSDPI